MLTVADATLMARQIVAGHFKKPLDDVDAATRLRDDLGADSLDRVFLLCEVERLLGREITDDVAVEFETVGDAARLLTELRGR